MQKLGDIELPEVTDSSEDEEITFTLNRSMLEMLKNLQSEITESENKQLRRAENRQARLKGEKVTYKTKKNDKNGGEPQSETPPAQA
ncbi:Uncharacterised protein [Salmonella enterica subsp. enterica serovar Typhi]|uniref:hypothetical protein n=1 Tax=Escherichia coli TaxID=562 RepID=UPI0005E079F8|nr:hypothetical protein [Escherichia coli]CHT37810.1 Uncharacterised protein [Salmonella enterica subsp. enterica serovar Typhi]CHX72973.1 Uncharacterised protein [Salmonella enterica subsp. enterica serovar Typhi]